jgi:hypothetical protein
MKTDFLLPFFISPHSLDLFLKKIINYKNRKIPFCGQSCVPYSFFVDGTGTHPTLKDICVFGFRRFPEVPFFFLSLSFHSGARRYVEYQVSRQTTTVLYGAVVLSPLQTFLLKKEKK